MPGFCHPYESSWVSALTSGYARVVEFEHKLLLTLRTRQDLLWLQETLRQASDSRTLRVMTRHEPLYVFGGHISIIGHITRHDLRRHLSLADVYGDRDREAQFVVRSISREIKGL